jgi:hypothetical protein
MDDNGGDKKEKKRKTMEKPKKSRKERDGRGILCKSCAERIRNTFVVKKRLHSRRKEEKINKKSCRQAAEGWNPRTRQANVGPRSRSKNEATYQKRDTKRQKTNSNRRRHSNQRPRSMERQRLEPWQRVRRRATADNRPPWAGRHAHVRLNTHIYDGERRLSSTSHTLSHNDDLTIGKEKTELKQELQEQIGEDTAHPRLRFPNYDSDENGREHEEGDIAHGEFRAGEEKTDDDGGQ